MILKDPVFDYYINVLQIDPEAKPYWDDSGNEQIGHACECTDSTGDEFCDVLEELLEKYEKVSI